MRRVVGVIIVFGLAASVRAKAQIPRPDDGTGEARVWVLPAPSTSGALSLEEALRRRRSVRDFTRRQLTDTELSQLLWAAQGITHPHGYRTAPSAGALYPLEIRLATRDGLYQYEPRGHRLVRIAGTDLRAAFQRAALDQDAIGRAAAVFVVTGVPARTAVKYGARAERYVLLEAGHAAQNLLLEAVALGLGAVPIGAFHDSEVLKVLGSPAGEVPLYLIPVGHPRR